MITNRDHIRVFEHQTLKVKQEIDGVKFDESKLKALQNYYGEKGVPYYSLIHDGIVFNEYVGAIQVGNTLIEVLPKADKIPCKEASKDYWQSLLIDMLRAVGGFDIKAPSYSNLKIKPNTILDLYFELFIKEVEYLLHAGLVKQYRKKEGNVTALKGSLQFAQHLQQNLTHQERFFVRHTTFDVEHKLHFILYKTLCLLKHINTNADLHSRIGNLLLNFPEMPEIKVVESTFDTLVFNRKTGSYRKAIEISKLLLLQYHPDLSKGKNHVLALMFDMNKLWEQFVYVSLRKQPGVSVSSQFPKYFWKPTNGYRSSIIPDIIINKGKSDCVVLDTKWKNLNGKNPSPDDLRQMYVYHKYFGANRVALIYPGAETKINGGKYLDHKTGDDTEMECSILTLSLPNQIDGQRITLRIWQGEIREKIEQWMNNPSK